MSKKPKTQDGGAENTPPPRDQAGAEQQPQPQPQVQAAPKVKAPVDHTLVRAKWPVKYDRKVRGENTCFAVHHDHLDDLLASGAAEPVTE